MKTKKIMRVKDNSAVKKLKRRQPYFISKQSIIWMAGFAAIGVITLLISHAATSSSSIEPESGSLSSGITQLSDVNASGGQAIKFGAPTVTATGCGLTNAVFCENFEEGPVSSANKLRSGDFDSAKISTSRFFGNQYAYNDQPNWVDQAGIPSGCRTGAVTNPLPPDDTLICEPSTFIKTRFGETSTAAQNYGDNFYRIAQPMSIANRTGTISFDTSLFNIGGLFGWPEIAFSDLPIAEPGYIAENANGPVPKEGLLLHLEGACVNVRTYTNYTETLIPDESSPNACTNNLQTAANQLNHVEVRFSQSRVEIWASDASTDGVNYGTLKKIFGANINLTISTGSVSFGSHNHATVKYAGVAGFSPGYPVPSWTVQWDNIAFDGPVIAAPHVFEAPDANIAYGTGMTLGYTLPLSGVGTTPAITFKNVTVPATKAQVSAVTWFDVITNPDYTTKRLDYSLNGHAWHSIALTPEQIASFSARSAARFNFVFDVDVNELQAGSNTIQFANEGNPGGYKALIANIDLLTQ